MLQSVCLVYSASPVPNRGAFFYRKISLDMATMARYNTVVVNEAYRGTADARARKGEAMEDLVKTIRPGDRVTIVSRFGKTSTGRAVMRSDPRFGPGFVLNLGGQYGTPAIATAENIVRVRKAA